MNRFCEWWVSIDWDEMLQNWFAIFIMVFLPIIAGALISISTALSRIEQKFEPIRELQQEIKRLDRLTEILEPARKIPSGPVRIRD